MRKHQQQRILELLQTLEDAHGELSRMATPEIALGLLADCQEFALEIGNYIEEIVGEGTQTVSLLEEYCELLYEASLEIGDDDEEIELANQAKNLELQLELTILSVKVELKPNKIEIAFLSYKASMSDSLESIYLAAKADPNCDAYWIPIPYYDRRSDGSAGTMHYEGSEYYSNVFECTDWQAYDIEERRPDAIFTFNPYDAGNYVTSVHPSFYCERLRELTDMLVYVPYFVVADNLEEHFCILPGCVYAHRVIVQSETIREKYIRVFGAAYGDRFGDPEEKFVALGSPKFDKVINSKREDFVLPDEWERLIAERKVVLYNTSINAILQGNEQYLNKLRHVLETFRERDDVALWWRPHPLGEATYASMRPRLLGEYEQIVADYRQQGWGIYDDTADLHRAIALTDAYYGDWSSLVALYGVTEKPSMIANIGYSSEFNELNLIFENICDDGDYLWFTPMDFNSLFRLDKETMIAEHFDFMPGDELDTWRDYIYIIKLKNSLFFIPLSAESIVEYSLDSKTAKTIVVEASEVATLVKYSQEMKFAMAFDYENTIYIIPYTFPGIVSYDYEKKETRVLTDWIQDLEKFVTEPTYGYFSRGLLVEGSLYLPCCAANVVLVINLETSQHEVIKIDNSNVGYKGICFDGKDFWLLPFVSGSIVRWNPVSGIIREYYEIGYNSNDRVLVPYINIDYADGYVYVLPAVGEKTIKICIDSDVISKIDSVDEEIRYEKLAYQYPLILQHKFVSQECIAGNVYAYSSKGNSFVVYNTKKNTSRKLKISASLNDRQKIMDEFIWLRNTGDASKENSLFRENVFQLSEYFDYFLSKNDDDIEFYGVTHDDSSSGIRILSMIKN